MPIPVMATPSPVLTRASTAASRKWVVASTIAFAFASVVAIRDIQAGEVFTEDNIWVMRPGGGDFGVKDYDALLGRTAKEPIMRQHQITKNQVVF